MTVVTAEDLRSALEVFARTPAIGCFDAVLVALSRRLSLPVASADRRLLATAGADALALGEARLDALTGGAPA